MQAFADGGVGFFSFSFFHFSWGYVGGGSWGGVMFKGVEENDGEGFFWWSEWGREGVKAKEWKRVKGFDLRCRWGGGRLWEKGGK